MRRLVWVWALIITLPLAALAGRQRVAVLQLRNPAKLKAQEVAYLTDLVRGAAVAVLPRSKYLVMTTESILALLPPGTELAACVGDCEVETGRRLGADYVATGEVLRFDGELRVLVSLYQTQSAQLIGQARISGAKLKALEDPLDQRSQRLFSRLPQAQIHLAHEWPEGASSPRPSPKFSTTVGVSGAMVRPLGEWAELSGDGLGPSLNVAIGTQEARFIGRVSYYHFWAREIEADGVTLPGPSTEMVPIFVGVERHIPFAYSDIELGANIYKVEDTSTEMSFALSAGVGLLLGPVDIRAFLIGLDLFPEDKEASAADLLGIGLSVGYRTRPN